MVVLHYCLEETCIDPSRQGLTHYTLYATGSGRASTMVKMGCNLPQKKAGAEKTRHATGNNNRD